MNYGPNVISFAITVGRKCSYIFGEYVPPNEKTTVHWVGQSLVQGLVGLETLLVGYINDCLEKTQDWHKEDLETTITNFRLVDQTLYFIPRW